MKRDLGLGRRRHQEERTRLLLRVTKRMSSPTGVARALNHGPPADHLLGLVARLHQNLAVGRHLVATSDPNKAQHHRNPPPASGQAVTRPLDCGLNFSWHT